MSLVLSSHPFSLSSKTPSRHRCRHRIPSPRHPKTPLFTLNPNKTPKNSIYAVAKPTSGDPEPLPKSAIQRIADKLRSLGFVEENAVKSEGIQLAGNEADSKIGEVFVPNSREIPNYRVGHTLDSSWSSPHNPVPEPGSGSAVVKINELRRVVKEERRGERERERGKVEELPCLAELTLPESELRRLRTLGISVKQKMKIGKAGVTEGIVNGIHERWRSSEVVKIIVEDVYKLNMKRTHDLLERKTGGMVVWRAGSKIVLYRGANYLYPYFSLDEATVESSSQNAMKFDEMGGGEESQSSETNVVKSSGQNSSRMLGQSSLIPGVGTPNRVRLQLPGEKQLEEEADRLLDGLGPRFTDWWGCEPLPVDADLLPAVIPEFRKPFRLLPYGVKPKLTNDEMTILKRLGRPLPCHFALGRNRKHQGLAVAMLKLWERCEIAKIAVKRGVQNTNSELMAEELKNLTGGVLLSRDKEFMVFYRGKDFLPAVVSSAIQERRNSRMQEEAQLGNVLPIIAENSASNSGGHASISASDSNKDVDLGLQERNRSIKASIVKTNRKLSVALDEKARAEKLLSELDQAEISCQAEVDKEGITEEERYMLRKVGLKMKPFLLLGRRGVFDGTIENMHLHWKYRELVKIICGGWNIEEIHDVARTLEAESGGILVAVEKVSKGHAIIVYRGKNYQRPASLRPQTLLNKKAAMKRSIEAQRRQSLKLNVLKLSRNVELLKLKLVEDKEALDGQVGQQLKSQSDVDEDEQTSAASDDRIDFQKGYLSPIEDNTSPDLRDTPEGADMGLVVSTDTVEREQTSTIIDPSKSDEAEATCYEISLPTSSDSSDASCSGSLFYPTCSDSDTNIMSEGDNSEHIISRNEIPMSVQKDDFKAAAPLTLGKVTESNSYGAPVRDRTLTNKERLLLRKQALKMKRRPVLAVGRSNVVSGVAKAIKDHFKKHPLAIVNVKGRAKGTSVQEVVFQLEQETGAVLISQEPSKVILYRGWGAGVENGTRDSKVGTQMVSVSPELLAAMRLECGLSSK